MRQLLPFTAAHVLTCLAAAAAPTDTEATYNAVFGAKDKQVSVSADTRDDVAFAAELLTAARSVEGSQAFRALVCRKAFDFGIANREGYDTAVAAANLLRELPGDCKAEAAEKLVQVRQLQYRYSPRAERLGAGKALLEATRNAADIQMAAGKFGEATALYGSAARLASSLGLRYEAAAFTEKAKFASARHGVAEETDRMERRLASDPNDRPAALRLLTLYLIEADDPAKGAQVLDAAQPGEAMSTYVPLAAKDVDRLPEQTCAELGEWYAALAAKASDHAKEAMLARARSYYDRFLELHEKEDVARMKVQVALAAVWKQTKGDSREEEALIAANTEEGYVIGPVSPYSKLTLRYIRGSWKGWGRLPTDSPDERAPEGGDRCRVAIAAYSDKARTSQVIQVVPAGTKDKPFVYHFRRGFPKIVLRINDTDGRFHDNPGKVRYHVRYDPR